MALTFAIPDVAATSADAYPVLYIVYSNLSAFFANIIAIIIFGGMWLCGLSSITSMSRMWFAFARDGGMPGHKLISQINHRLRTPIWSILITSTLAVLICIYSAAYFVVTSISTITLYLAYGIPIFLNWRNKRQKKGEYTTPETAPWSLKKWGPFINVVSFVWIIFITILFCLPPNELVFWTMILLTIALVAYWQLYAKKHFTGPRKTAEEELRRIEKEMAEGFATTEPAGTSPD